MVTVSSQKLGCVSVADGMIGGGVHSDVHGSILEIDLLVAACSVVAVPGTATADFLDGFLRLIAVELAVKNQSCWRRLGSMDYAGYKRIFLIEPGKTFELSNDQSNAVSTLAAFYAITTKQLP